MTVHKKFISNVNDLTVVKFTTSENLNVKSLMLPNHNNHKFTSTPPDGKTHSQVKLTTFLYTEDSIQMYLMPDYSWEQTVI
jgi:hypothetical protein